MNKITTHILDTVKGCPAAGVQVILYRLPGEGVPEELARGYTNGDGRILNWEEVRDGGVYKLRFETEPYFGKDGGATFYPFVEICFEVRDAGHYHVPLLISPFGYSTYRGS